jgi:hypothetical protein
MYIYVNKPFYRGFKMLTEKELQAQRKRMYDITKNHNYTKAEIDAMIVKKHGLNASVVTTDETNAMLILKRE